MLKKRILFHKAALLLPLTIGTLFFGGCDVLSGISNIAEELGNSGFLTEEEAQTITGLTTQAAALTTQMASSATSTPKPNATPTSKPDATSTPKPDNGNSFWDNLFGSNVGVATLDDDLKNNTYGLLNPQECQPFVGRQYYDIDSEESLILAVHDGLMRGIPGIVLRYKGHDYNYWLKVFNDNVNRSELSGFTCDSWLICPEENNTMGCYPVYNHAWKAYTYYRYHEPEIDEDSMKVLQEAHKIAEEAIKASPDDEKGMILYVNDKLRKMVSYPHPIPAGLGVPERDATGVFFKGKAVCAGYAVTTRLVLSIIGIDNTIITNSLKEDGDAGHIWNYVKYNGSWYHLDVTWNVDDDSNTYFMITDDALSKLNGSSTAHKWPALLTYE
jgi:hypothetical protein